MKTYGPFFPMLQATDVLYNYPLGEARIFRAVQTRASLSQLVTTKMGVQVIFESKRCADFDITGIKRVGCTISCT